MTIENIKILRKNKGFTIVELLVVIVVIGILASITIVSYSGITARANTAANQSNAASIQSVLSVLYADTSAYPAWTTDSVTTIGFINAGAAKVNTGIVLQPTVASATNPTYIGYVNSSATGKCISYWNYTGTPAVNFLGVGGAVVNAAGTTCS